MVGQYLLDRLTQWETGQKIGQRTAERYRELINNQIIPHLGNKQLQKLKAIDIEAWHGALIAGGRKDGKGGISARTIGHAHRVLSKALKEAARFDLVTRNVASAEKPPKVPDENEVQIVEQHRLEGLLTKLRGRVIYPKVVLSLFAGLRRGELLARWRHVDLDRKILQVREALEETKAHGVQVKTPKSKAGRRDITLPNIVTETLREHRRGQLELHMRLGLGKLSDEDDLLFPTLEGTLPSPRAFSAEWADVAASIGMPDITFHALRHTHASQLIDAGVDVVTIAKRLGHSGPNITLKVYAHLFRDSDDKAAAAINDALAKW